VYSEVVMDHFNSPRNVGFLEKPDRVGSSGKSGQGPFMVLQLRIQENRIVQAGYKTYGCGPAIAAGSLLTEMITDMTLEDAKQISVEKLVAALGGLPPEKQHCAQLAIDALQNALGGS